MLFIFDTENDGPLPDNIPTPRLNPMRDPRALALGRPQAAGPSVALTNAGSSNPASRSLLELKKTSEGRIKLVNAVKAQQQQGRTQDEICKRLVDGGLSERVANVFIDPVFALPRGNANRSQVEANNAEEEEEVEEGNDKDDDDDNEEDDNDNNDNDNAKHSGEESS